MWLRDFHVDGLRLDAVHALFDDRAMHARSSELAREVDALSTRLGRPLCADRRVRPQRPAARSRRARRGGSGSTAQWADDVHHALHVAADRRDAGLLRRLRRARARSRRCSRGSSSTTARWSTFRERTHGAPGRPRVAAGLALRRLAADPRPGRQPRAAATGSRRTRPPGRAGLRRGAAADRAGHADALHGRGVGRLDAVAVLHRPHRARDRRGRAARPARRSSPSTAGTLDDVPDPQSPETVRALAARLGRAAPRAARAAARVVPRPDRACAASAARPARPAARSRARRARRRGAARCSSAAASHVVVVNLAAEPRTLALPSAGLEVVLAWDPAGVALEGPQVTLARNRRRSSALRDACTIGARPESMRARFAQRSRLQEWLRRQSV